MSQYDVLGHYEELSSLDEIIKRRHISFRLSDILFHIHKVGPAAVAIESPLLYADMDDRTIRNLADSEARNKFAYKIAEAYIKDKYANSTILDLKIEESSVTFTSVASTSNQVCLSLNAKVSLEEKAIKTNAKKA